MCYRPIHIFNPSRHYCNDMPKKIAVPCGHCADCQRNKHNEWFFRCMVEYNRVRSLGGAVYFITLTYNNDNLPYFTLPDGTKCQGFSRRHVHNFMKYFRILLKKRHLQHKEIKYLICSEYGSHTRRPHYHGLLFVSYHIPNNTLLDVLRTAWHYGFVIVAKQGLEVVSPSGVRYASKYVCKDLAFEKHNPAFERFIDCDFAERKARLEPYKEYLPKHYQSVGFGESWIDDLKMQEDIAKYLAANRVELDLGKHEVFKIPRYYHLKTEKVQDKYLSLVLGKVVQIPTELGKEVKRIILSERVSKDMALLRGYTADFLSVSVPTYDRMGSALDYMRKEFPCHKIWRKFDDFTPEDFNRTRSEFIKVVSSLSLHIDPYKFSVYRCFLRQYPIFDDEDPEHKFVEVGDIISHMICGDAVAPEVAAIDPLLPDHVRVACPFTDCEESKYVRTCSEHPYFQQYETIARMIDWLDGVSSVAREYTYLCKKYNKELVKFLCPNIPNIYQSY